MGGYGSSRWSGYIKKPLVEQAELVLDSHQLMQDTVCTVRLTHLLLVPTPDGPWRFQSVNVRREGTRHVVVQWLSHTARVAMQTTPALGGTVRWWFTCPLCQRRCRKLYLLHVDATFGCRRCHNLVYRSAQTAHRHLDAAHYVEQLQRALTRLRRETARLSSNRA